MTGWPSRPRGRRLSQNRNEGQRGREERGVLGYQAVWAPQWEHTATSWEGARARQGPRRRGARRAHTGPQLRRTRHKGLAVRRAHVGTRTRPRAGPLSAERSPTSLSRTRWRRRHLTACRRRGLRFPARDWEALVEPPVASPAGGRKPEVGFAVNPASRPDARAWGQDGGCGAGGAGAALVPGVLSAAVSVDWRPVSPGPACGPGQCGQATRGPCAAVTPSLSARCRLPPAGSPELQLCPHAPQQAPLHPFPQRLSFLGAQPCWRMRSVHPHRGLSAHRTPHPQALSPLPSLRLQLLINLRFPSPL